VVLPLLALVLLAAAAFVGVRSLPGFEVTRVILPETTHVDPEDVTAAVRPLAGQNLFSISTDEIERQLLALPYVKSAQVHRRFPDAVDVLIEERRPFARMRGSDGRAWLIAEDGRILAKAAAESEGLILFRPARAPRLKPGGQLPEYLRGLLPLAAKLGLGGAWQWEAAVTRVNVSSKGEAALMLEDGIEVRLGTVSQLDDKLMVAQEIIKEYSSQGRPLAYVDVYLPERPVAKEKSP
jgi:cell division protein FtsQ